LPSSSFKFCRVEWTQNAIKSATPFYSTFPPETFIDIQEV